MSALWTSLDLTLRGRVLCLLIALSVGAAWLTGDPHARLAASLLLGVFFGALAWVVGGFIWRGVSHRSERRVHELADQLAAEAALLPASRETITE